MLKDKAASIARYKNDFTLSLELKGRCVLVEFIVPQMFKRSAVGVLLRIDDFFCYSSCESSRKHGANGARM